MRERRKGAAEEGGLTIAELTSCLVVQYGVGEGEVVEFFVGKA
jgi:hypothetical protein